MAQSGYGKIRECLNMIGASMPIGNTETGASMGPFQVTGSIDETDSGIAILSKTGGWARLTGTNEDGYGIALGTNVGFSPALNGPLAFEVRLEMQALSARQIFAGFASANAADVIEPCTISGTAITPVATSYAGFMLDSQITTYGAYWHMPHNGGTTTGETLTTDVQTTIAVLAVSDVLRVEIDPNGDVRWLLNGSVKQTIEKAVSTTTLLAGFVGSFGTTTTITDVDVNYIAFEANRNWTI